MTDKIEALREKAKAATSGPWEAATFVDNRDSGSDHHTCKVTPQRGVYGSLFERDAAASPDVILSLLSELDRLRSSNEAMRKALAGSHRLFLPIFMRLAEAELVGEPVKDETVLFSFMGSGASDHVTVGDFRKAHEAARSALSSLQEEEAQ